MKTINELQGKNYLTCSACMSVWADGLSWANAHPDNITKNIEEANNVVLLSCQVTDLSVLNDLRIIESYKNRFPDKNYYVSGCLAKRDDVALPEFISRLNTPRENYQFINDRTLVNFEKPFWVPDFKHEDSKVSDGHLFRDMYPLRIGKGCPNHCTYCTINKTRGGFEMLDDALLEKEFLAFEDVLLIADSPTSYQIKKWHNISMKNNKPFSIRNVEPSVTVAVEKELYELAERKLLTVYHSPIQSADPSVLKDMNRSYDAVKETMRIVENLKKKGVYIATNIIIDYKDKKQDFTSVYDLYDYVSWNPLWDGKWNRKLAEERYSKYIQSGNLPSEVCDAMKTNELAVPKGSGSLNDLLEKMSEQEHIQWQDWSETLWKELSKVKDSLMNNDVDTALKILDQRHDRWKKNWIPYVSLSDDVKEFDRIYARKILDVIKDKDNKGAEKGVAS